MSMCALLGPALQISVEPLLYNITEVTRSSLYLLNITAIFFNTFYQINILLSDSNIICSIQIGIGWLKQETMQNMQDNNYQCMTVSMAITQKMIVLIKFYSL